MFKFNNVRMNLMLTGLLVLLTIFPLSISIADNASKFMAIDPMLSQWLLSFKCREGAKDILICEVARNEYMSGIFPELKENIMKNKADNAESLMLLNPKAIFVKKGAEHNLSEVKKSGIEIVSFDFEKPEDIFNGIKTMGEILKMEKRAEEMTAYFKDAIDKSNENAAKNSKKSKPRVYFANSNIYQSFGNGMYQNFLIETAGGASVTSKSSGAKIQISIEELIKLDPEIIITASYCSDKPGMIIKNEKLKDLSAVKNEKIFVMPHYVSSWDMPIPESILGITWLSAKIYPESKIDLNKSVKDFYQKFYNLKIDDEKIKNILN